MDKTSNFIMFFTVVFVFMIIVWGIFEMATRLGVCNSSLRILGMC